MHLSCVGVHLHFILAGGFYATLCERLLSTKLVESMEKLKKAASEIECLLTERSSPLKALENREKIKKIVSELVEDP